MARIVMKFGGTSVADIDRIRNVANRVAEYRHRGDQVVVVVSAMGSTTDELIALAHKVSRRPQGREGERGSHVVANVRCGSVQAILSRRAAG